MKGYLTMKKSLSGNYKELVALLQKTTGRKSSLYYTDVLVDLTILEKAHKIPYNEMKKLQKVFRKSATISAFKETSWNSQAEADQYIKEYTAAKKFIETLSK